ncbi:multidrug effflux MFS transporter [Muricauda sp. NFXS6]|uniref:multidrug effflux MFS transporter n=1 Tax=Allomuricauda sp. NFXS6 TaxID=2819094 RepID=UPI0032E00E08
MQTKDISFLEFIALVAMLMAMVALTINMMLPAFDQIANDLQVDERYVHLSISLLYLGLGLSQFLFGPISDRFGRKPSIYLGLFIFGAGCTISLISSHIVVLITGQLVQGIGLGAPRTLSIAIVRDRFKGARMARTMSFVMIIYLITPVLSPILGKQIVDGPGWRVLFVLFLSTGLVLLLWIRLRMPETLSPSKRGNLHFKQLWSVAKQLLGNGNSMGFVAILGIHSGVFIAYLNLSQSLYENHYALGADYPYYFASMSTAIGIASFINGKIVERVGMRSIVTTTLIVESLLTMAYLMTIWAGHTEFYGFLLFMFLQLMGYGFIIGNITALAMEPLEKNAGLGSAIIGAVSTILATPISLLIGFLGQGGPTALAIGFMLAALLGLVIISIGKS